MIGDIREHLKAVPFVPFSIRMASGHEYPVPTIDHVWIPPGGSQVIVSDDHGISVVLPGLMISGLVRGPIKKRRSKPAR
jgi:hypothetical protein